MAEKLEISAALSHWVGNDFALLPYPPKKQHWYQQYTN